MHAELGSPIFTEDGTEIGTIEWLVLDSGTKHVRRVVLRRGFFDQHGIRIALSQLDPRGDDQLTASISEAELRRLLAHHEAKEGRESGEEEEPPAVPETAAPLPAETYLSLWRQERHQMRPSDLRAVLSPANFERAIIDAGSDVVSRDGQKVGEVRQVTFDTDTGQLGSVIFRHEHHRGREHAISAEHVGAVADGTIYLDLPANAIEDASVLRE